MFENKIGKFKCAFCGGAGIQPRSLKSRCLPCRGKGEVEFENSAIICPSCKGTGRSPGALELACIRCKGVGIVEKREAVDVLGERLGEITKRLSWTRKETEKKTKEVEKRLKSIKPFISAKGGSAFGGKGVSSRGGSAFGGKKETQWLEKLGNKIKEGWRSLWEQ